MTVEHLRAAGDRDAARWAAGDLARVSSEPAADRELLGMLAGADPKSSRPPHR